METKMASQTELIVKLREKTGAGMMDCKKALTEAGGDYDKAIEFLRKKGMADASKRSARVAKEGVVAAYVSPDGKTGALVELNCETDFVAKTEDFQKVAIDLAKSAADGSLKSAEAAVETLAPVGAKVGENVTLRRFERFQLQGAGALAFYIHTQGFKKGAFLEFSCASDAVAQNPAVAELGKELGLQIVALAPKWLERKDVPAAEVEKEKEIYAAQLKNEGKPEAQIAKIVEGKLNKLFFQANCLLDAVSMRDNKTPISNLVKDAAAKAGGAVTVRRFVRYQLGE
ncbi:MAG: translation elongation factor Ts [Elusimicrobia bacterium]|nr:translation elongation factor Ts [Elusimicrobiota bacterium]